MRFCIKCLAIISHYSSVMLQILFRKHFIQIVTSRRPFINFLLLIVPFFVSLKKFADYCLQLSVALSWGLLG